MTEMQNFVLWFLQEFPAILLTPPISAFTGFYFLGVTIGLFKRMIHL